MAMVVQGCNIVCGQVSIGYTYPPLRAEPLKARETGSRSVQKKYIQSLTDVKVTQW